MSTRIVVMGVSGCGKSHIGAGIADDLSIAFYDGDGLHPQSNIEKMSRGEPLNDDDREPWLKSVGEQLESGDCVVACSALKRKYRDQIRATAGGKVCFLVLSGSRDILLERMSSRDGHFMPVNLLDSQLATLEMPDEDEWHYIENISQTPQEIRRGFINKLSEDMK